MTAASDGAWQVRVHGVGGPQARRMLGALVDEDTETLGPDPVTSVGTGGTGGAVPSASGLLQQVPADKNSRVVRRVGDPEIEAYEWGGLTLGSVAKALWVVYLPLTILNASGWSHKPSADHKSQKLMHVVCGLGTLTYVGWIGYLLLDLVGRQWRDRLAAADLVWRTEDIIRAAGLPAAHVLFIAVLVGLWWVNGHSGAAFEGRSLGEAAADWEEATAVYDPRFFGHQASYRRLFQRHLLVVAAGVVVVIGFGFVPRSVPGGPGAGGSTAEITSIGAAVLVLAAVQSLVLLFWWISTLWTRDFTRVATATLGSVLCHATFVGLGIVAVKRLSGWPRFEGDGAVVSGAELGLADHLLYAVIGGAVALLVFAALTKWVLDPARPGYDPPPGVIPRIVHAAPTVATLLALGFVVSILWFIFKQVGDVAIDGFVGWYEGYRVEGNAAQSAGGLALSAIPLAVVAVLRRPRDGAVARVLGNVWDVLTFWPRRFHPFAVPPYAERAVPELRWLIRRRRQPGRPLVVAGHSQGSVLSFVAVGAELEREPGPHAGAVSFLGFGSPIGTLYATMFKAYFGPAQRREVAGRIEASGGRWWNLYRGTDPIGGPVVAHDPDGDDPDGAEPTAGPTLIAAWFDKQLPDPRPEFVPNPDPLPVPLERSRPPGSVNGHNFYLADPTTRALLATLRTGAPIDVQTLTDA